MENKKRRVNKKTKNIKLTTMRKFLMYFLVIFAIYYRGNNNKEDACMIVFIDKKDRSIIFHGKCISLSKKEFLLFELLVKNRKIMQVDNETVVSYVWGNRCKGIAAHNISQLIYLVRRKMKEIKIPMTISYSKREGVYTKMNRKVVFFNCRGVLIKAIIKSVIYNTEQIE